MTGQINSLLHEQAEYTEKELETALIDNLQGFLLELGKGFTFVARQKRITLEAEHFYVDLVFYNRLIHSFVLIDLKIGKLTHQDLGQMQMYVNYFDLQKIRITTAKNPCESAPSVKSVSYRSRMKSTDRKVSAAFQVNPRFLNKVIFQTGLTGFTGLIDQGYFFQALKSPFVQADLVENNTRIKILEEMALAGHSGIGRGIYITAGCFSPDGVTAYNRPSSIIGVDGQDLYFILENALLLDEVLRHKIRWLVETGDFYYPVAEFLCELDGEKK